jgi:hypothetical protein
MLTNTAVAIFWCTVSTLMMIAAVFAETLVNNEHSTRVSPEI